MTRLRTEWIEHMLDGMDDYNRQLQDKIGLNLAELTCKTWHLTEAEFEKARNNHRIAIVPVTQGEGIISAFSQSVAAIVYSMGFQAFVTGCSDVDGIWEGTKQGCDIFFLADDTRYLALNIKSGKASDNNYATALGFINALKALMNKKGKDIYQEKILQIGYGAVGKEAAEILLKEKVDFHLFDIDMEAVQNVSRHKLTETSQLKEYQYMLDFTNQGGWMKKAFLHPDLLYASPGVPHSMDEETRSYYQDRAVHDNLEIGTAIMLGQIIAG
ncbi:3-methylornithyl-N6-L-lysine dehydrogenase PylD [Aminipila butyrica]|uniref:3-methylornithyl-N6-L-lysine dehydrogenase PylD n=1 Tax=Aminipila butyrica TaxID=433296 RepID=A0A858BW57_9FIRM|nr:3-methylornithyl-N6-L-lysine dehydrogenase PylD [Aminipila butyrica]QIB70173.1 3-methylornithyl-N6-L-lysine dehydrogenase PylD [Aminipila butyrica]